MCRAFGLPWIEVSLMIGAICVFAIGSQWRLSPGGEKTAIFLGMGIALINIAVSFGLQILTGAVDHGTDVLASPRFATLRLIHIVFTLGLLRHISSDRNEDDDEVSRWGLAASPNAGRPKGPDATPSPQQPHSF